MIEKYLDLALAGDFVRANNKKWCPIECRSTACTEESILKGKYLPAVDAAKRTLALLFAINNKQSDALDSAMATYEQDVCFQLYTFSRMQYRADILLKILQRDDLNLDELLTLAYFFKTTPCNLTSTECLLKCVQEKAESLIAKDQSNLATREIVMLSRLGYCHTASTKAWYDFMYKQEDSKKTRYLESHGIPKYKALLLLDSVKDLYVNSSTLLQEMHSACNVWTDEEFERVLELESTIHSVHTPICQAKNYKRLMTCGRVEITPRVFKLGLFEPNAEDKLTGVDWEMQIRILQETCRWQKQLPFFFKCDEDSLNAIFAEYDTRLQPAWEKQFSGNSFGDSKFLVEFLKKQDNLTDFVNLLDDSTFPCFLECVAEPAVRKALIAYCNRHKTYAILAPKAEAFSKAVQAKIAKDARDIGAKA